MPISISSCPTANLARSRFWTRVAERMIDMITAYTGEGIMFAVDTRFDPNGREGPLVQTESAYKDYLANRAEAWEGITYMKSRAVAGNSEATTKFLHELQQVDWRRYGQSGRSRRDLREMRARLEREQGSSSPLKAGSGGYYDIDFALMYLRLKSAGIFYKVLNTPERIDIIEKMGHLERDGCRVPARCRHLLSGDRSRAAGLLRSCGGSAAKFTGSSGNTDCPCESLDARTSARRASSAGTRADPDTHARILPPVVRITT